jgi:propionyl-CoA synthetase
VCLVLLKDGSSISDADLQSELVAMVRNEIGAAACLKQVLVVPRLPKTRPVKILCKLLRQITEDQTFVIPSTIDDQTSIDEIKANMQDNNLVEPSVNC